MTEMEKSCGFWAHCALHCDLPCDHDQWCPDYRAVRPHPLAQEAPRMRRRLLNALANWAIGPQCDTCGERRRGPRTLAVHRWTDHGDLT